MIDIAYCDNAEFYKNIKLSRAGHIFANAGRQINRPHGREDYLLFYVAAGSESFFIGGEKICAPEGSFIVFAPGETQHHICESEGVSEFYYVHFECDKETFCELFSVETSHIYESISREGLAGHFQEIISELQLEQPFSHEIAVMRLCELFLRIKRSITEQRSDLSNAQIKAVHKIIHSINKTWKDKQSLDDYANEFNISKYHLAHIFKKYTGFSLMSYRNRLHLRYAKGMLEKTDMSMAEIAENVGFAGQQYFCESFKESFGISPTDYRKKNIAQPHKEEAEKTASAETYTQQEK